MRNMIHWTIRETEIVMQSSLWYGYAIFSAEFQFRKKGRNFSLISFIFSSREEKSLTFYSPWNKNRLFFQQFFESLFLTEQFIHWWYADILPQNESPYSSRINKKHEKRTFGLSRINDFRAYVSGNWLHQVK